MTDNTNDFPSCIKTPLTLKNMACYIQIASNRNSLDMFAPTKVIDAKWNGRYTAYDDVNNIPVCLETSIWLLYLIKNSDFNAYCSFIEDHHSAMKHIIDQKYISMPSRSDIDNLNERSDISTIRKICSEKALFDSVSIITNAENVSQTSYRAKFRNSHYCKFNPDKRAWLLERYMIAKELFERDQCYSYHSIKKSIGNLAHKLDNNNSHIVRTTKTYKKTYEIKYEWELQIAQRDKERSDGEPYERWYLETVKSDLNLFRVPHRIEVLYLAQPDDSYLQNTVKLLESLKNMFVKSQVIHWILKGDDRYVLFSDLQRICQEIIDDLDNIVNMKNINQAYQEYSALQCKEDVVDDSNYLKSLRADVQFLLEDLDQNNIYTLYTEKRKEFDDIYFKVIKLLQFFSSYTGDSFDYSAQDIYYKKYREALNLLLGSSALTRIYGDIVYNAKINSRLSFENCFTRLLSKINELNSLSDDDIENSPLNSYYSEIIVGLESAVFTCIKYLLDNSNIKRPPYLQKGDDKIMLDDMKKFLCSNDLDDVYNVKQDLENNINEWRTQVRNGKCHKEIVDKIYLKKHDNTTSKNDSIRVILRNNLDDVYKRALNILADTIKIVSCNIDQ